MKLSAVPEGNKFKVNGLEYVKANHSRGLDTNNVYKTFSKHKEVEVERIIIKYKTPKVYKG